MPYHDGNTVSFLNHSRLPRISGHRRCIRPPTPREEAAMQWQNYLHHLKKLEEQHRLSQRIKSNFYWDHIAPQGITYEQFERDIRQHQQEFKNHVQMNYQYLKIDIRNMEPHEYVVHTWDCYNQYVAIYPKEQVVTYAEYVRRRREADMRLIRARKEEEEKQRQILHQLEEKKKADELERRKKLEESSSKIDEVFFTNACPRFYDDDGFDDDAVYPYVDSNQSKPLLERLKEEEEEEVVEVKREEFVKVKEEATLDI